jgi:Predicted membrane protein
MSSELYEKIRNNPKFQDTVIRRSKFSWTLALIVLVIFYGFILLVAFAPSFLATPLWEGSTTTVGVPVGLGIIVFFWLLTGYYIHRANNEFDATNKQILGEAMK